MNLIFHGLQNKNGSRAHLVNALAAADEETYACNMQYGVSQTRKQSDVWQADKNSARIQHYFMHMNYGWKLIKQLVQRSHVFSRYEWCSLFCFWISQFVCSFHWIDCVYVRNWGLLNWSIDLKRLHFIPNWIGEPKSEEICLRNKLDIQLYSHNADGTASSLHISLTVSVIAYYCIIHAAGRKVQCGVALRACINMENVPFTQTICTIL